MLWHSSSFHDVIMATCDSHMLQTFCRHVSATWHVMSFRGSWRHDMTSTFPAIRVFGKYTENLTQISARTPTSWVFVPPILLVSHAIIFICIWNESNTSPLAMIGSGLGTMAWVGSEQWITALFSTRKTTRKMPSSRQPTSSYLGAF